MLLFWLFPLQYVCALFIFVYIHLLRVNMFLLYSILPLHAIPIDRNICSQSVCIDVHTYGYFAILGAFALNAHPSSLASLFPLTFLLSVSCHFSRVHFKRAYKRRPQFFVQRLFFLSFLSIVCCFLWFLMQRFFFSLCQPMGQYIGKVYFQFSCAFTSCRMIRVAVAAAHFYSFIFLRFLLNFYVIKMVVSSFCIDKILWTDSLQ